MKSRRSAVKPTNSVAINNRGRVFLVGAGPGAPDLITLRGAAVMGSAEVIVYDSLVSPEILRLAPAGAERIFAGKKGGAERSVEQAEINQILIEYARAGRRVVRLKGGDPFIFGRGGEEAEALVAAGIPFEVVPGVTSAIAVPAFAGIPLTHRQHGSFVAFITGHQDSTRDAETAIPWDDLARAARGRGTLVIMMATARMGAHLARLAAAGLGMETPAAAIQWGTTAAQKTVVATLGTLADEAERQGLKAPAVIVVGECAALGRELNWFEAMPLFGRRIVITRAAHDAGEIAARIRALGGEAIEFPTIETALPSSYEILDRAIAEIGSFDWIVFTSANGVDHFVDRMRTNARDLRAVGRAAIAAIGPITANRVRHYALNIAAMPAEYRAEAIIDAIGVDRIAGTRVLIPRAETAREVLPETLRQHGAHEVVVAPAYRTVIPAAADVERMRRLIADGMIDLVTFTSSSTVTNFAAMTGAPIAGIKAAAIGPITAETARGLGFEVVVAPVIYTVEALIDAIVEYYERTAQS
ncbi:MAG: uroporphyrinogen methyltransferase / synthase [Candidatus Binataceae bacterium]|nr:uroporphyrinogen methyltransferase / synthase [Candidatus Binataceae bacterium]